MIALSINDLVLEIINLLLIVIGLMFRKELILMRKVNQRSVLFVTIVIFYIWDLSFNQLCVMTAIILLMMSLNINHIIIFNIIGIGYRCIIVGTSKSEDINLLRNTYVSENSHYIYVYLSIYINVTKRYNIFIHILYYI